MNRKSSTDTNAGRGRELDSMPRIVGPPGRGFKLRCRMRHPARPNVPLRGVVAQEKFNSVAFDPYKAGRLAPIPVKRKSEHVAAVWSQFHDVIQNEAQSNRVPLAPRSPE